jgi:hypothetical protein
MSKHASEVVFFAPANGEIGLTNSRGASKWYAPGVPREEGVGAYEEE